MNTHNNKIKLSQRSNSISSLNTIIKSWLIENYPEETNHTTTNDLVNNNHKESHLYSSNTQTKRDFQQNDQDQNEEQLIDKKIANIDSFYLQKKLLLKFPLQALIEKVPLAFIQNIVLYAIIQKLFWTITQNYQKNQKNSAQIGEQFKKNQVEIENHAKKYLCQLSLKIKQAYQQIILKNNQFWKSSFNFQFLCVFMTLMTSSFIKQNIKQILIQKKLMSQIYVIIVHVLLGIQVSLQTFCLIAKKFIKKLIIKNSTSKKIKIKSFGSSQFTTRKNLNHQLNINKGNYFQKMIHLSNSSNLLSSKFGIINETKNKKLQTNNSYQQNYGFQKIQNKSVFNQLEENNNKKQFLKDLQQNLYVEPLPPVIKKKIQINQIDKKEEIIDKQLLNQFDKEQKKVKIRSNQLSLSMNTYLKKSMSDFNLNYCEIQEKKQKKHLNLVNLKNSYLPIKGINMKMKSQKSSAHYRISQNNSFQKQQQKRQLQSQRLLIKQQKKKEPEFKKQKNSFQKKKKNVIQWNKIIEDLKEAHPKQNLTVLLHNLDKKRQNQIILPKNENNQQSYKNLKNQIKNKNYNQIQKKTSNQIDENNLKISIRMSQARASSNVQSILKYAHDLNRYQNGQKQNNPNSNQLKLQNKDYSSLQPRVNENQYKQNIEKHKLKSFELKKNFGFFSQNCKKRNQYIISSIFKKNDFYFQS